MKGQEIINHIVRTKMPDKNQVRENCHQQAISRTGKKRSAWILSTACVAVCVVISVVAVLIFGNIGVNNMPPVVPDNSNGNHAVYVPAIELSEKTDGTEMMSTLGLFIYQGRIYMYAGEYFNEDAKALDNLIGERIGYARGNLSEWSNQDKYAVEFAGTTTGDVYTVKGYDPQFRLCIKLNYKDDNGEIIGYAVFLYENQNGIGLTFGSDLFGDRLHLRERWSSNIKYQKPDKWGDYNNIYYDLEGVSNENITAFIDELYSNKFECIYQTVGDDDYSFFEQKSVSLVIRMKDNTVVGLRLFESGYIGYGYLAGWFVKMPGEASERFARYLVKIPQEVFDIIYNACK